MKKYCFYAFFAVLVCVLTVYTFVFFQHGKHIKTLEEKQLLQEGIMLKQAEILAVNTTLLQAVFRSLPSFDGNLPAALSDHVDDSKRKETKPNLNRTN